MTTVRDINIKKIIVSVLIWSVLNAGIVLLFEFAVGNAVAEVIASAVFSMLWVIYAAVFCRREKEQNE